MYRSGRGGEALGAVPKGPDRFPGRARVPADGKEEEGTIVVEPIVEPVKRPSKEPAPFEQPKPEQAPVKALHDASGCKTRCKTHPLSSTQRTEKPRFLGFSSSGGRI